MIKNCPFLGKFYIPPDCPEDWHKWVENECCPLEDLCIFDIEGRVPPILIEKLRNANLACPKCQKDAVYVKEVKSGERISGLRKNEDGDWACLYCGFVIYATPLLKKSKEWYNNEEMKKSKCRRSRK